MESQTSARVRRGWYLAIVSTWAALGITWVVWRGFQLQDEQAVAQAVAKQIVRAVDRGELPAVVVVDNDGMIFDWSIAGTILTGWTKEEVVGKDVGLLVPVEMLAQHEKAFTVAAHRFGKARKNAVVMCDMLAKDGGRVPVRVAVFKAGDDHFAAVITKRQKDEPVKEVKEEKKMPPAE